MNIKKLTPFKKTFHLQQSSSNGKLVQCFNELIRQQRILINQQKITNQLLQTHFYPRNNQKMQKILESKLLQQEKKSSPIKIPASYSLKLIPHNQHQSFQRQSLKTSFGKRYAEQNQYCQQESQFNQLLYRTESNKVKTPSQTLRFNQIKKESNMSSNRSQTPQLLSLLANNILPDNKPKQENQKKSNYNVLSEFIPHTDRRQFKFLVPLPNITKQTVNTHKGEEQLKHTTTQWIGDVYRMAASMCWNMMLNGFLNYQETKILFTQNIIYNYIQFMKKLQKNQLHSYKHKLTTLMNQKSVNVLDFLCKQYPQTKIQVPNIRLKQIVPKINNADRIKFDLITIANKKDYRIQYRKDKMYARQVMELVNFMIDQTTRQYQDYEKQCLNIFQQLYKPTQKRISGIKTPQTNNSLKKANLKKEELDLKNQQGKINQNDINKTKQSSQDISYKQKAKKYVKFLIGRKIDKNVPKYSRQQINKGIFIPKSTSILRIITKWVEQLMQIINNPEKFILSADRQLKSHTGNSVFLFNAVRKALCDKINSKKIQLNQNISKIKSECQQIQSILCSSKYTKDQKHAHLSQEQIAVGKFSICLQKAISQYIFFQLNLILDFLLHVPFQIDQNQISLPKGDEFRRPQIRKQLDRVNLVTMKIFDLLRCKCISNDDDIIWIMEYLKQRYQSQRRKDEAFKIVRVKDRLNQGTRDINCNLRFSKDGMLSEMQLCVVSNIQSKQQKLDSYNHFLYELKRSRLGPLSENVLIWTVLEQRSLYFQDIKKNKIPEHPTFFDCCKKQSKQLVKINKPITCQTCNNFYAYPQTCYSNRKCSKCLRTYCGDCLSKILNQTQKKDNFFQNISKMSSETSFVDHIKLYTDWKKQFPMSGICFKKNQQNKQLYYFSVLIMYDQKILEVQDLKKLRQKYKLQQLSDCSILLVHNYVRDGKVHETLLNKQQKYKIKGKFNISSNKLIIDEKSVNFFDQYLIFYFDNKFQKSTVSVKQIKQVEKLFGVSEVQEKDKRIINIMQDPLYIDQLTLLKKKSQKLKQIKKINQLFNYKNQKDIEKLPKQFQVYKYINQQPKKITTIIIARVYRNSKDLWLSINYASNMAKLKQFATIQKSVVTMQHHGLKNQIQNINHNQYFPKKLLVSLSENLRKLYLNYNYLQSVQGLREFKLIEFLFLRHNKIKNLKGLQNMKSLKVIRCDDNQIQDLTPLSNLTNLSRLMGIKNKINNIDPLINLTHLKTIQLQQNQIKSLNPIKNLPQIEQIIFKNNKDLKEFPQFSSKNIQSIILADTMITNLQNFSKFKQYKKFKRLILQGMNLNSIPSFIRKMKLKQLWLGNNKIKEISNLEEQEQLEILSLKDNQIENLTKLGRLQKIKFIDLENNKLTSLEGIQECIIQGLKKLNVMKNALKDINALNDLDEHFQFIYTPEMIQKNIIQKYQQNIERLRSSKGSRGSKRNLWG